MQITQQNRNMVLIAVYAPLAISLTLAASYLAPLWEEAEKQHKEIESKEIEYRAVQDRMMQKNRLIGARNTLEQDIVHLRSAVPSTADLDVLMLDLQKMARMANVEILSISNEANSSNNRNGERDRDPYSADQELEAMFANISGINRDKDRTLLKPKDTVSTASKDQAPPLGIKQIQRRLYVTGQYADLVAFLRALEKYQRVLAIKDMSIGADQVQAKSSGSQSRNQLRTQAQDKAQKMKLSTPVLSFLLNVYYLP